MTVGCASDAPDPLPPPGPAAAPAAALAAPPATVAPVVTSGTRGGERRRCGEVWCGECGAFTQVGVQRSTPRARQRWWRAGHPLTTDPSSRCTCASRWRARPSTVVCVCTEAGEETGVSAVIQARVGASDATHPLVLVARRRRGRRWWWTHVGPGSHSAQQFSCNGSCRGRVGVTGHLGLFFALFQLGRVRLSMVQCIKC